jgi:glycosyltransferase involved in cell wall biosynthesis
VIPNPVPPLANGTGPSNLPRPRILAAGRLTHQKGFDLLIEAFSQLAGRYPDWHLVIAGEGEERPSLEAQRQALGLTERIHLPGFVADMGGLLASSELFVLPSRFEGFPNALCEAMAAGLAVIAADCPSGPADIICSGEDGLLVEPESPAALAQALERMMSDPQVRHAMGDKAQAISSRFHIARVLDRWFTLISACRKP